MNQLYYGDNLDILRRYIKDETVDLIYLDPPFNSKATYNVLFGERNGSQAAAQIKAFDDTWTWDTAAAQAYQEVVEAGGKVSAALQAFRMLLGDSNMLAYLAMMAPRLVELRRVLKPSGSIYLHCDPTASHYLKMLMDAVFDASNFRNEIIWKRTTSHGDWKQGAKVYGRVHDTLLFYTKTADWVWSTQFSPFTQDQIDQQYGKIDANGRRYRLVTPTAKKPGGDTSYEWKGVKPPKGRFWAYTKDKMADMDARGLLYYSRTGQPYMIYYLDERPGVAAQSIWTDVPPMGPTARERLGYPTQKPEALLERIIQASSPPNGLVLDPFCGCGTTIAVAERLKRRWIGIDITHLAIGLMKHRLRDSFGADVLYEVIGEPVSLPDAGALAESDPYQFQWWALGLVGARPVEQKKGSDKGIDGRLYFHDEAQGGKTKQVILSVKAGHNVGVGMIRDLGHVVTREGAEIGVLLTMQEPTQPMRSEAAGAGFYHSPGWNTDHPRLQILTVANLLEGKKIDMPAVGQVNVTFKKAPKPPITKGKQAELQL